MRFNPEARRCSYCGRWGSELTCRGCGGPHSPDDDRALIRDDALYHYSKRRKIDEAFQNYRDALKRSVVPEVVAPEGMSFKAYNRMIEMDYSDPGSVGLINWRM